MKAFTINQSKQWLKTSPNPIAKVIFKSLKAVLHLELPAPKFILRLVYSAFIFTRNLIAHIMRILCWTPLFKGRVQSLGKYLNLYGGLPFISGPVQISIGDNCRVSGQSTFSGRTTGNIVPTLTVGNNVDIGWMTTIAVGNTVQIGNNVRIAGRTILAGYPGHPLDPTDRAKGLPELDSQVGEIILEDDVWLATGVSVMAGVRIGQGTIVAAGSVVTHDLPAMVLAGGIPAKVIRSLKTHNSEAK
ncbi:acyltransferase [Psychromonas sp. Urea-02u-13]|uniref:acyltransferase n=1 Tax=Psychromonas sp. Urea-02u-13 TaxID=2058326 RepID=UPI000C33C569|nr:acyltransferase [Psychromonas sp. Urea-02u-13]PKG37926.1 acetyltransferase [Psychromonas sp. Urea-02u-13]